MREYELRPIYDSRASFYKKAHVQEHDDGTVKLRSYNTIVATIKDGLLKIYGEYSNTTRRHIKEFMSQNGLLAVPFSEIYQANGEFLV